MKPHMTDRRATGPDAKRIVQQGLLIQACLGTISAVEFLKAHDVEGATIERVLTSGAVRAGDRAAPLQPADTADAA